MLIKSNLKEALSVVERASGENLKLLALKYSNMETQEENKIKVTATNLEIAITFILSGNVIEKGRVNIPTGTVLGMINNLQSERLNLETKGGQLEIKTDNYEASTQTIPSDDFPIIPKIKNEEDYIELEGLVFRDGIIQVLAATQFSELRTELNTILFDFNLETLKLVGTDSFRLAEKTINSNHFKTNQTQNFRFLLPLKTAQELSRILKDDEVLRIYHDQNQVLFKTEHWEMISRLTEGNFPEYSNIIPKSFDSEVILEREELINALKLTGVFSSQTSEVKVKAVEGGKAIEIYSASQDLGENRYVLPAKLKNNFKEVGFNWRYLADGLRALKTSEVFLGVNEQDNKPSVIKSPNEASFFYILMPILKT